MAKKAKKQEQQQQREDLVPTINGPRLPYHPAIQERFDIDKSGWKALVEAVFPNAETSESVILALSYCKARHLDPFKKCVHIVPIWDNAKSRYVETIWPGIGELRTTAFRTQAYAGRDMTTFGPDETRKWGTMQITFPSYAQVTVYRMIQGERVAFAGPPVYWMETYASKKGGVPNKMWEKRPRGQLDKCAEAAALRAAFPEEIGDQITADEGALIYQHGGGVIGSPPELPDDGVARTKALLNGGTKAIADAAETVGRAETDMPTEDPETKAKAAEQKKRLKTPQNAPESTNAEAGEDISPEVEKTPENEGQAPRWQCLACGKKMVEPRDGDQCPACLSRKLAKLL